ESRQEAQLCHELRAATAAETASADGFAAAAREESAKADVAANWLSWRQSSLQGTQGAADALRLHVESLEREGEWQRRSSEQPSWMTELRLAEAATWDARLGCDSARIQLKEQSRELLALRQRQSAMEQEQAELIRRAAEHEELLSACGRELTRLTQ
ncbi:unnamed protein product, partial [Polarella glacialis]